jgi:ABC-type enterochelin transport system substrate-binding protein
MIQSTPGSRESGCPMNEGSKTGQVSKSIEKVTIYNMALVDSLAELLVEKGVLDSDEIKDRLKKVLAETTVHFKRNK